MGEYVGRIYDEVKRRPRFIVEAMEGFERDEQQSADSGAEHSLATAEGSAGAPLASSTAAADGPHPRGGPRNSPRALTATAKARGRACRRAPVPRTPPDRLVRDGVARVVLSVGHPGDLDRADARRRRAILASQSPTPRWARAERNGRRVPWGAAAARRAFPRAVRRHLPARRMTGGWPPSTRGGLPASMTVLRDRGPWAPATSSTSDGLVSAYDKRTPPPEGRVDRLRAALRRRPPPWPEARAVADRPAPPPCRSRRAGRGRAVRARFYEFGTPEAWLIRSQPCLARGPSGLSISRARYQRAGARPARSARGLAHRPRRSARRGGVDGHRRRQLGGRSRSKVKGVDLGVGSGICSTRLLEARMKRPRTPPQSRRTRCAAARAGRHAPLETTSSACSGGRCARTLSGPARAADQPEAIRWSCRARAPPRGCSRCSTRCASERSRRSAAAAWSARASTARPEASPGAPPAGEVRARGASEAHRGVVAGRRRPVKYAAIMRNCEGALVGRSALGQDHASRGGSAVERTAHLARPRNGSPVAPCVGGLEVLGS